MAVVILTNLSLLRLRMLFIITKTNAIGNLADTGFFFLISNWLGLICTSKLLQSLD